MSLIILQEIYEKLKNDFASQGLGDKEIELIKDMIHADGKMGDEKVISLKNLFAFFLYLLTN
jgi:hypothetical protein